MGAKARARPRPRPRTIAKVEDKGFDASFHPYSQCKSHA